MAELLYENLTYSIVGAALEVHRLLGPGFLEAVYEQALAHELSLREIPFERQVSLLVMYKEMPVGEYWADFVIDGRVILEIKASCAMSPAHELRHVIT